MKHELKLPLSVQPLQSNHGKSLVVVNADLQLVATSPEVDEYDNEDQQQDKQAFEFIARACNNHYALLDALTLALPYVETALEDQGYKPGAVDRMVKQIRQAIENADK